MDFLDAKPSVQPLISFVLENGEIPFRLDTGHLRSLGQRFVVGNHFLSDGETLLILGQLVVVVDQLLLARLYGEVSLPNCDDLLARVAVHDDQVAGIAGKPVIFQNADSSVGHRR